MSAEALLKLIPGYVSDLLELLSGPRKFFSGRDLAARDAVIRSLAFLFSSTVIAYVLRVPVLGDSDAFWSAAVVTVVFYTVTAVVLGAVAFCCCRIVGGKGALAGHVTIFSYVAGISTLILAIVQLIARGIVRLHLPNQFDNYREYMRRLFSGEGGLDDPRFAALAASDTLLISMLVLTVGYLLIAAWVVLAWRSFRDWNDLNKLRNAIAFVMFLITGYGVSVLLGYAQHAAGIATY